LVAAVGVHDPDGPLATPIGYEGDMLPIRRPCGQAVISRVIRQAGDAAPSVVGFIDLPIAIASGHEDNLGAIAVHGQVVADGRELGYPLAVFPHSPKAAGAAVTGPTLATAEGDAPVG
jgi:hypothetical protein